MVRRDLDNIGTTYLANKLSNHLINEITRKLPDIQSYVDKTCVAAGFLGPGGGGSDGVTAIYPGLSQQGISTC